ncbi:terminase [Micromonospora sp. C72]|nr:terminase [Micromonospora sp. C72]
MPLGRTEPRLWTPPLRDLTPETSYGFDVIEFARDILLMPLDPWQEFAVVHAGELLEDGTPRFRKILILVSRQNGKTHLLVVLTAYWMFIEQHPMILGTSTKLAMAKESWTKMMKLVERTRALDHLRNLKKWSRTAAGEEECFTLDGSRYKIAASNESGGRGLTLNRLVMDELRQHKDYAAWDAAVPAGSAVDDFQAWGISNAGSDASVVLNEQRELALKAIESGDTETDMCIMEWSAPEGASPLDLDALAQANPNLGRRIKHKALLGDAKRAVDKGGDVLAGFLTENMCIRVPNMDGAIDPFAWGQQHVPGDLFSDDLRSRIALCLDISPDRQHASLVAAAVLPDGRVRVDLVNAWEGSKATARLRRELPGLIQRIKPQAFGWMPKGPAAALAADLKERKGVRGWPPAGIAVEEINAEVAAVCMGLAEQVETGQVVHANQPALNAHITGAEKLWNGDVWRFSRKGEGHCDAAYAAAGAVHLARTLPTPVGKPRLIVANTA